MKAILLGVYIAMGCTDASVVRPIADINSPSATPSLGEREAAMSEVGRLIDEGAHLAKSGKHKEAILPTEKGLSISEKYLGEGPYTSLLAGNLAVMYANVGQFDKAEPLYKRWLSIKQKLDGKGSVATVVPLTAIGMFYTNLKRYSDAEIYLSSALSICDGNGGVSEDDTLRVLTTLQNLYKRMGRDADAAYIAQRIKSQPTRK